MRIEGKYEFTCKFCRKTWTQDIRTYTGMAPKGDGGKKHNGSSSAVCPYCQNFVKLDTGKLIKEKEK